LLSNFALAIEVQQETTQPTEPEPQGALAFFQYFFMFLAKYWLWFVTAIVIMIILGVLVWLVFTWNDKLAKDDSPGYELFTNIVKQCRMNADKSKIKETYSLLNLFFLGLPIFKNEHSAKLIDANNKSMGWYRGHSDTMDNYRNFLIYQTKKWLVIPETFVVRVPLGFDVEKEAREDENGKPIEPNKKGEYPKKRIYVPLEKWSGWVSNGDYKINSFSLEKGGKYYFFPVFNVFENGYVSKFNYKEMLEGAVSSDTTQVMVQRLLNLGARQMEKGIAMNADIKAQQVTPKKIKTEEPVEEEQQ
jgi:hypothetical protein